MTQSSSQTRTGSMLGADVRQLLSNLNEMVGARRELAELEIRADVAASKRLVWQAGVGAVLVLTGLPVLVVFLAQVLHAWRPVGTSSINAWGPILAGSLMLVGPIFIWVGYRRFRREFLGLRRSMAEFREDVQWLREWAGVRDQPREE